MVLNGGRPWKEGIDVFTADGYMCRTPVLGTRNTVGAMRVREPERQSGNGTSWPWMTIIGWAMKMLSRDGRRVTLVTGSSTERIIRNIVSGIVDFRSNAMPSVGPSVLQRWTRQRKQSL